MSKQTESDVDRLSMAQISKLSPAADQRTRAPTDSKTQAVMSQDEMAPADTVHQEDVSHTSATSAPTYRYDIVLWLFGVLFIIVLHCMIFGFGEIRGWEAWSAYRRNESNSSMERFLEEPFVPEPGVYKRSDAEASGRWYYWKLKPEMVTPGTRAFVWCCYALHNLSVWLVLYLQQKAKTFPPANKPNIKYSNTPDKYNWTLFGINIFFHLLHLVNTHTTYDGLAQDVSEGSSQSSVIVALILMLFIEFGERGIILGFPSKAQLSRWRSSIWLSPLYLIRKYHGYFIYWAAIFTFWYHPMENTPGHAFGFTHTWFMMLQGSMTYQLLHLNKYWRLTLEFWVAIHALVIASQSAPDVMGKEIWPMFFFGFSAVLVLTQLYGLPVWSKIPSWCRCVPLLAYITIAVTAYSFIKDVNGTPFVRLQEIIRIPGIYYLLLAIGWLAIVAVSKLQQLYKKSSDDKREGGGGKADDKNTKARKPSITKEVVGLGVVFLLYLACVLLSWLFEYLDIQWNLLIFTFLYSILFLLVGAIGGSFFLKMVFSTQ